LLLYHKTQDVQVHTAIPICRMSFLVL